MKSAWVFLDGKKTTIGAGLFLLAWFFQFMGWVDPRALQIVDNAAVVLTALGLGHKVAKAIN